MRKKCSICKQFKDTSEYNKHPKRKDGLQSHCKLCGKIRSKCYYQRNLTKHKEVVRSRKILVVSENKQRMLTYLSNVRCKDCSETDPIVLEFDHVRGNKRNHVSKLLAQGSSWGSILQEIAKCDVVCANCHRRRTYTRSNSYRISG